MTLPRSSGRLKTLPKAPFAIRRVIGDSMLPTLKSGQLILVLQWRVKPRVGQIIMFEHNGLEKIKRISDIRPDEIFVLGDNLASSSDSRQFGWVRYEDSTGIVVAKNTTKWYSR
ncbi:MAG: S26 family signal peptidase [Candidatus Saccharibacteria bacterium]